MFGALKKAFGAGAKEIKADYSQNKDYLEAVCAASALVAYADGDLEDSERSKVVRTISQHPTLGKMYQQTVIEGRDGSMAEDVYLVALDVAHADGQVEPEEAEVLKKIAARLGVDISKFEF